MKKRWTIKCYKLILLKKSKYQEMAKARGGWSKQMYVRLKYSTFYDNQTILIIGKIFRFRIFDYIKNLIIYINLVLFTEETGLSGFWLTRLFASTGSKKKKLWFFLNLHYFANK